VDISHWSSDTEPAEPLSPDTRNGTAADPAHPELPSGQPLLMAELRGPEAQREANGLEALVRDYAGPDLAGPSYAPAPLRGRKVRTPEAEPRQRTISTIRRSNLQPVNPAADI
jgi:hypothetical protein